ncbi:MAG: hypothetical protein JW700_01055 [Candidatus Aenigmarchaeota archaeon]|nr:hypothetical protein [Candidatus Aenigmarchaeota archaeon]
MPSKTEATLFLILLLVLSNSSFAFAQVTVQYDQEGEPLVDIGLTPTGDYEDLNILGEDLTYDIEEEFKTGSNFVDIWHNSTQIADGSIDSINITINFTSNVSDDYSLNVYDWENSLWVSSGCDFGTVPPNTPTKWWCNITSNAMDFNSSDGRIRFKINSTGDSDVGLLKEDYVQYYVGYASYLEVEMLNPDTQATLNIIQNKTFFVNTSIVCRDGPCGNVFGTVMYNLSSEYPNYPVNDTFGDKPFFVNESPLNPLKPCGSMLSGDFCLVNWSINATADINSGWKIGAMFNSSFDEVEDNATENVTISISDCTIDINMQWSSIIFGMLDPSSGQNSAEGNDINDYNVTVNEGSCNLDIYINGTDLTNETLGYTIGVSNISWSNTTNDFSEAHELSKTASLLGSGFSEGSNITSWYWINVPPVYTGYYAGSIYVWGVKNGQEAP